jgi:ribonuclease HI
MIEAWVDGANRGNGKETTIGGYGIVLKLGDYVKEFNGAERNTTNNRMELLSCIEALRKINKKSIPITIYTDSQYVCDAFNKGWLESWRKNNWRTSSKQEVKKY